MSIPLSDQHLTPLIHSYTPWCLKARYDQVWCGRDHGSRERTSQNVLSLNLDMKLVFDPAMRLVADSILVVSRGNTFSDLFL